MSTCSKVYFQDILHSDAKYADEAALCTTPECVHEAQKRRNQREQDAYLKYIGCIGTESTSQESAEPA